MLKSQKFLINGMELMLTSSNSTVIFLYSNAQYAKQRAYLAHALDLVFTPQNVFFLDKHSCSIQSLRQREDKGLKTEFGGRDDSGHSTVP